MLRYSQQLTARNSLALSETRELMLCVHEQIGQRHLPQNNTINTSLSKEGAVLGDIIRYITSYIIFILHIGISKASPRCTRMI